MRDPRWSSSIDDGQLDEAVRAKFGVAGLDPDWLALVGDSADGFPGLPGWGAKSAAAVLARYQHIDAIPDLALEWDVDVRGATRLAATLAEHRDDARLFLELATLRVDAAVGIVDDWCWTGGRTPGVRRRGPTDFGQPELAKRPSRTDAGRFLPDSGDRLATVVDQWHLTGRRWQGGLPS